ADDVESLDVRDRIRARSAADGRLIDEDDLVQKLIAFDAVPQNRAGATAIGLALGRGQCLIENVMQQRRLSRAGDARNRNQHAERDFKVDVLQVVRASAGDAEFV